jgi:hypothetical protein
MVTRFRRCWWPKFTFCDEKKVVVVQKAMASRRRHKMFEENPSINLNRSYIDEGNECQ